MSDSSEGILALPRTFGNWVGSHYKDISAVAGAIAFLLTLLNTVFGVSLTPYGDAFVSIVLSDSLVVVLLFAILISQVFLYQRVAWILNQVEDDEEEMEQEEPEDERKELVSDGGDSNLPPRDDEGKFRTGTSGSSNLLILVLGAVGGYAFGAQSAAVEPVTGAMLGVAAVSLLQAFSN